MRRELFRLASFTRAAKRLVKKNPGVAPLLQATLEELSADAFQPSLKTHKLKGSLAGSYACSTGYDLRIVFRFVEREGAEAILLQAIGTHDEVY
jgi:mRNA interferase YafQ